jgi:hypothetical protein
VKKSNTAPVIMYPEGVIVGKVRSGRVRGKVRHIAFDADGTRVGTFDSWTLAKDELIGIARQE